MVEKWVLVCDGKSGQTRDCVVAIRALAGAGYHVAVPVRASVRLLSRHVHRRIEIGEFGDVGFTDRLKQEIHGGGYAAFVPASENVVLDLADEVPELLDKRALGERARAAGLTTPRELLFESYEALRRGADELPYPVVVKPVVRHFTAFRARQPADIHGMSQPDDGQEPLMVQPFVEGPMTAVAGVMWAGRLHSATHELWTRIWPRECGLASRAVSVAPDIEIEVGLEKLMNDYEGLFVAQFVGGQLIDLNLRVHSSLPLSVHAGTNLPAIYSDLRRGVDPGPGRGRPGSQYRWIAGDLKSIAQSVRHRDRSIPAALAELVPVRGMRHSMFALSDPAPFFARFGSYIEHPGFAASLVKAVSRRSPRGSPARPGWSARRSA